MMIYLTGADTSLVKSSIAPQKDAANSLGGYVSSTVVSNSELNSLFDLISSYTLEKKRQETIALAIINKLSQSVNNVTLKIVVDNNAIASFKVAAVSLDSNLSMEHISNRYSEPMIGDFYKADFVRAYTRLKILSPAIAGEVINLSPFNIIVNVINGGIEGL